MPLLAPAPTLFPGPTIFPGESGEPAPPTPTDAITRWETRVAAGELDVVAPVGYGPVTENADTDGTSSTILGFDLSFELAAGSGGVVVSHPLAQLWLDQSPHMQRLS